VATFKDSSAPGAGDKKPVNSRTSEVQRRVQTMQNRKPVSPQVFFQEAWVELKKTTWPNRQVLVNSTIVVLALVLAVAIWEGVLDRVFSALLNPFFGIHS
jgi:preprotein translocase SecE subunit